MKESNKAKGKAAVKQDLEDTLNFYNASLTRKVVGQLFDEYVKDDEYPYYTSASNNYKEDDYEISSENNTEERSFYFGNTFSEFPKDELISEYNSEYKFNGYDKEISSENDSYYSDESDNYSNNAENNSVKSNIPSSPIQNEKSDTNKKKKNEYYEYDDFDDDFDEYDYEPKKKKKNKKTKIKKESIYEDDDYREYEDVLDRKKRERESLNNLSKTPAPKKLFGNKPKPNAPKKNFTKTKPNIIITDLTASKKKSENYEYSKNLPPLESKTAPHREPSYEDVLRYSPRRRGGRNQSVKKKKRIPLSENKNIYPEKTYYNGSKQYNEHKKTVRSAPKPRKRNHRLRIFFVFSFFALIISLVFCIIKISKLTKEVETLKTIIQSHSQYNNDTYENETAENYTLSPDSEPI